MRRFLFLCFITLASFALAEPIASPASSDSPEAAPASQNEDSSVKSEQSPKAKSQSEVAAAAAAEDAGYMERISQLSAQIDALKEKSFRAKARIAYLQSTVLTADLAGAYVRVMHVDDMGPSFKLESVTHTITKMDPWTLDDQSGRLSKEEEIPTIVGHLLPGDYTLSVLLVYRGSGYGVFSYLKNYVFNVVGSYDFRVEDGRNIEIRAVGFDQGGMLTELKDRPRVRFEVRYLSADSFESSKESK